MTGRVDGDIDQQARLVLYQGTTRVSRFWLIDNGPGFSKLTAWSETPCKRYGVESRPERPPVRVWQDWLLVGLLLTWAVLEALLREDPRVQRERTAINSR
jgi:hypothetical protein